MRVLPINGSLYSLCTSLALSLACCSLVIFSVDESSDSNFGTSGSESFPSDKGFANLLNINEVSSFTSLLFSIFFAPEVPKFESDDSSVNGKK